MVRYFITDITYHILFSDVANGVVSFLCMCIKCRLKPTVQFCVFYASVLGCFQTQVEVALAAADGDLNVAVEILMSQQVVVDVFFIKNYP